MCYARFYSISHPSWLARALFGQKGVSQQMKSLDEKIPIKKFEEILIESVDEAFSCLGENMKNKLYNHLRDDFMIARDEIPYRIDDFSDTLDRIFGVGARHLEILIMKKLHEKVNSAYHYNGPSWLVPNLTFSHYVKLLKLSEENEKTMNEIEVQILDETEKPRQRV